MPNTPVQNPNSPATESRLHNHSNMSHPKRLAAALALAAISLMGTALPAHAATPMRIAFTKIGIYPRAEASMSSAKVGNALSDGTTVSVECEAEGQPVSNGDETISVWEQLTDGTWIPNAFVATGYDGWTPGVPRCSTPTDSSAEPAVPARYEWGLYDRPAAAKWASDHAYDNPVMDEDCTWFVTQALWAGGFNNAGELTSYSENDGAFGSDLRSIAVAAQRAGVPPWKPFNPARTATMADRLPGYLESEGHAAISQIEHWSDNTANGAELGDIIAYDWNGDTKFDHLAMVTSLNEQGYPSVSEHSNGNRDRYWSWSKEAGNWIEFATQGKAIAYLVHITY